MDEGVGGDCPGSAGWSEMFGGGQHERSASIAPRFALGEGVKAVGVIQAVCVLHAALVVWCLWVLWWA